MQAAKLERRNTTNKYADVQNIQELLNSSEMPDDD